MMYLYIAIALLVGLLLGKALFGKKAAPAPAPAPVAAVPAAPQGDADIITIPGVRCHPLDPSNDPSCSPSIKDHGLACKTIFDCTVPYREKGRFTRAEFMEVDPSRWL